MNIQEFYEGFSMAYDAAGGVVPIGWNTRCQIDGPEVVPDHVIRDVLGFHYACLVRFTDDGKPVMGGFSGDIGRLVENDPVGLHFHSAYSGQVMNSLGIVAGQGISDDVEVILGYTDLSVHNFTTTPTDSIFDVFSPIAVSRVASREASGLDTHYFLSIPIRPDFFAELHAQGGNGVPYLAELGHEIIPQGFIFGFKSTRHNDTRRVSIQPIISQSEADKHREDFSISGFTPIESDIEHVICVGADHSVVSVTDLIGFHD